MTEELPCKKKKKKKKKKKSNFLGITGSNPSFAKVMLDHNISTTISQPTCPGLSINGQGSILDYLGTDNGSVCAWKLLET